MATLLGIMTQYPVRSTTDIVLGLSSELEYK